MTFATNCVFIKISRYPFLPFPLSHLFCNINFFNLVIVRFSKSVLLLYLSILKSSKRFGCVNRVGKIGNSLFEECSQTRCMRTLSERTKKKFSFAHLFCYSLTFEFEPKLFDQCEKSNFVF